LPGNNLKKKATTQTATQKTGRSGLTIRFSGREMAEKRKKSEGGKPAPVSAWTYAGFARNKSDFQSANAHDFTIDRRKRGEERAKPFKKSF